MADTDKAFKSIGFTMLKFHGCNGERKIFRVKHFMCEDINLFIKRTKHTSSRESTLRGRKEGEGVPPSLT